MHVAHLIKGLGRGGAESLLPYLIRSGGEGSRCSVGYFLPWKDALIGELERAGAPVHGFRARSNLGLLLRVPAVAAWLRRSRPDLLHAHLPLSGAVGRLAGRLAGVPVVYTEHNLQERYHPATYRLNRWTWGLQAHAIAVSAEVAGSIRRHHGGRVPVTVVPNGVPVERFRPDPEGRARLRRELGIPDGAPVVGNVAVLRPQKRFDHWLEAARRLRAERPELHFLVVGDGPLRDELHRLAHDLGLADRVHWAGLRDDVRPCLAAMDLYMMSSEIEGLPVSILEAMATELPVVATAVGGVPEAVAEGETGRLVAPGDPARLARAAAGVLADRERARCLGRAGRERVSERFGVARMARELEAVYTRVLEERRDGG